MAYVPFVPPTNAPPPSPRTRELAGLVAKVLSEYTKAHPATTKGEIRAAVRLAQMSAGSDMTRVSATLSLVVGLGVAALLGGLFYFQSAGGESIREGFPMVIMAVIVFLGIVAGIVAMKSR